MQREDGSFAARLAETSRGASLLEVLAATAMLSIVIGVVLATLVSLTGNQQRQERMVARQETVRLALDQVSRDLRGATSIAIFSNVGDYAQQIEAEVWKADETRQWVRWSLNGNHLQRHILTGPGGQTLSFATVATGLSAGDGGEPLLRYYDKHADELTSAQPAADFATCAVRVRVSIAVAASEGAPAFGANTAVELRNRQGRGVMLSRRDDNGNVAVTMAVLMLITSLALAALTRTTASLVSVRRTQDRHAALAAADGGIAQALWQLQNEAHTAPFSAQAQPLGKGTFGYTASVVDSNTWSIESIGTVNRVSRAVKATARRDVKYPYVIFTEQDLTLNGNTIGQVLSYDPATALLSDTAAIGSNHAVTVNGGGGASRQDYYTPDGSCSGCPNPYKVPGPRQLPVATLPSIYQPCPGTFSGQISGQFGVPFLCDQDVVLADSVIVENGPVTIYVTDGHAVSAAGATVNEGGNSTQFRLRMLGGRLELGNGSQGASLTAIVDAPRTSMTVNGGEVFLRGAFVLNQVKFNGGPNVTVQYDLGVRQIPDQSWRVTDWHETPTPAS